MQKMKKIGLYKTLMNRCHQNLQERARKGSEMKMAEQKENFKKRTKDIQNELKERSDKIKENKVLEKKRREVAYSKMEAKKKELMKQQVERRKAEELEGAKKARDMIDENRRRVQLQSELLAKG